MSDEMQRVGFVYNVNGGTFTDCQWPPEDTEPHTMNEMPRTGKCDVCGDVHFIGTEGQCAKG